MVTELIIVWVLGVVMFFVPWAVLLKVIKRISERKERKQAEEQAKAPIEESLNH